MASELKEPGQRAYEAWCESPDWALMWHGTDEYDRRRWAAVEQALSVPEPAASEREGKVTPQHRAYAYLLVHGRMSLLDSVTDWIATGEDQRMGDFSVSARVAGALAAAEAHNGEAGKAQAEGTAVLVSVIRWLYDHGHKSAAVDLDCNWNDGPPGDGTCRKIRDLPLPSPPEEGK